MPANASDPIESIRRVLLALPPMGRRLWLSILAALFLLPTLTQFATLLYSQFLIRQMQQGPLESAVATRALGLLSQVFFAATSPMWLMAIVMWVLLVPAGAARRLREGVDTGAIDPRWAIVTLASLVGAGLVAVLLVYNFIPQRFAPETLGRSIDMREALGTALMTGFFRFTGLLPMVALLIAIAFAVTDSIGREMADGNEAASLAAFLLRWGGFSLAIGVTQYLCAELGNLWFMTMPNPEPSMPVILVYSAGSMLVVTAVTAVLAYNTWQSALRRWCAPQQLP